MGPPSPGWTWPLHTLTLKGPGGVCLPSWPPRWASRPLARRGPVGPGAGRPVAMVGPPSHLSCLVFGQVVLDGGLRFSVPLALLGSPEAAVVSCPLSAWLEHPLQPPLPLCLLLLPALWAPLLESSLVGAAAPVRSQRASSPVAGPSLCCPGGGQLCHTHAWQQMYGASPGVVDAPPADPWIERSSVGTPCVYTTVEQTSSARGAVAERAPVRARLGPRHLRWRALAAGPIPGAAGQLPDLPLRAPLGQPQAPGGPSLGVGSPRPRWRGTTVGFIPRVLRRFFKPQTALPSAALQCSGPCLQPRAGHWWPHSCPW